MLAKRLPSILPEMNFEESLETTKIHSIRGKLPQGVSLIRTRPFRSPHHTIPPPVWQEAGRPLTRGKFPWPTTGCSF